MSGTSVPLIVTLNSHPPTPTHTVYARFTPLLCAQFYNQTLYYYQTPRHVRCNSCMEPNPNVGGLRKRSSQHLSVWTNGRASTGCVDELRARIDHHNTARYRRLSNNGVCRRVLIILNRVYVGNLRSRVHDFRSHPRTHRHP